MEWYNIIAILFGAFGGLFGSVSSFMFYKANRRIKTVESKKAEWEYERQKYEDLKKDVDDLRKQISDLNHLLSERQGELMEVRREQGTLQRKYTMKKVAINCALECKNAQSGSEKCPVLRRQAEFDLRLANESDRKK
jgi:predicted RNase H-like nuclease (RuvC/YqgF family)